MLKIGIIVCAHGNKKTAARLRKKFEKEKVDAIVLAGDLGDEYKDISAVLKAVAPVKMPIYVFPGNHESSKGYYRALKKYKKAIEGSRKRRITIKGYDLVSLPSANVTRPGAGFRVAEGRVPKAYKKRFRMFYIHKLKRFVRKPAKTIIISHGPPRCGKKDSIDVAYSGEVAKPFVLKPKDIKIFGKEFAAYPILALFHERGEIMSAKHGKKLAQRGYPVSVKHRNVGSNELKKFLKRNKIKFFACGHIHEAGHRAINAQGKRLKQGQWSTSIWYNAAAAENGQGGILIIDGNKGTFKNIRV